MNLTRRSFGILAGSAVVAETLLSRNVAIAEPPAQDNLTGLTLA